MRAIPLLLLSVLATLSSTRAQEELIRNGDVQRGGSAPEAWGHMGGSSSTTFAWHRGEKGNRTLRIAKKDPGDRTPHNWSQRIELPAKRPLRLELSARIRAADMALGASACAMIQLWGEDDRMVAGAWSDKVEEDTDWRRVTAVFEVTPSCRYLRLLAYLVGGGEVDFDDFTLRSTEKEVTPPPGARPSKYELLARECSLEIDWLFDAQEARKRAARERRPLLVYVRCIDADKALESARKTLAAPEVPFHDDGLRKDVLMRAGPFSDSDLVELIRRRFVPLLMSYDLSLHGMGRSREDPLAPLGLSAPQVITPAIAVLSQKGKVVHKLHRIGTLNTFFIDRTLRGCLEKLSGARSRSKDPLELYLAGELERARKAIGKKRDAASRVLLARTLARLGELDRADAALKGLGGAEARLQHGLLLLYRGDYRGALAALKKAKLPPDHARAAERSFWAAWCERMLGNHGQARKDFKALAGANLLGRKAAASLLAGGPFPALAETPQLFELGEALPEETELRDPEAGFDWRASIEILLRLQRADGSFGSHDRGFWDPAISSLVGRALLRWRKPMRGALAKRADDCLKRIDEYLVAWGGDAKPSSLGAFNNPYALMHLVERQRAQGVEKILAAIAKSRLPDGNWSVYPANRPASFNTALHVMALALAKRAGHAIPEEVFSRGIAALAAMRTSAGLFPYSTKTGHEWMTTEHGSIARDPLCEHALLLAGHDTRKNILRSLERFREHHRELRRPTKKLYDYFNSRGHGGYYFFFANFHAREAALTLPKSKRKRFLEAIRSEVIRAREFDGTWIDKTLLGRAYGTAMALCILAE